MLLDPELYASHLAQAPEGGLRDAFEAFAHADYPEGLTVRPTSNGFVDHELRIEQGENWYFSAVLKEEWVLWYFRKPAFRDGLVEMEALQAALPEARLTPKRELAIRVSDAETAAKILGMIGAPKA